MKTERRLSDIKAVIFDLDGLVLDTERTYFAAWQLASEKLGKRLSDEFCRTLSGLEHREVMRRIEAYCGNRFDRERFDELSALCWREYVAVHGIAVKKGFFELLRTVRTKRLPFCLATNSFQRNALECLRYAGLEDTFPLLVGRDSVAIGKPAPDIFYRAAELVEQPVSRCLIVEDSPIGIEAATQTGAMVVFVPSITPASEECLARADLVFADLARLADFVRLSVFDAV